MTFQVDPTIDNEGLIELISEMKDFLSYNRWHAKYSTEVLIDEKDSLVIISESSILEIIVKALYNDRNVEVIDYDYDYENAIYYRSVVIYPADA